MLYGESGETSPAVDKETKVCSLKVHLVNHTKVTGTLHVAIRTGTAIRPSDAIRELIEGFLVLTDATIQQNSETYQHSTVMIQVATIAHIELPPGGWATRTA